MRRLLRTVLSLLGALLAVACPLRADPVHVAVAANFSAPMQRIAAAFERETGHTPLLSFGATGKLRAQIENGAPFELLLAADDTTAGKLVATGAALEATRFTYAIGRLALWSPAEGVVDAHGEVLARGSFRHLAIANPRTAPYGAAALEVLGKRSLLEKLGPKLVQGESIAQAYQFVASGNAELGFVALSQLFEDGKMRQGSVWLVPEALHRPLRQEAVVLSRGAGKPATLALIAYLRSDAARAVIRAFGYSL